MLQHCSSPLGTNGFFKFHRYVLQPQIQQFIHNDSQFLLKLGWWWWWVVLPSVLSYVHYVAKTPSHAPRLLTIYTRTQIMYTHGHIHTSTTANSFFVYNMAQVSRLVRFTRKRQTGRGRDLSLGVASLNITSLARQTKLAGPAPRRGKFRARTTKPA